MYDYSNALISIQPALKCLPRDWENGRGIGLQSRQNKLAELLQFDQLDMQEVIQNYSQFNDTMTELKEIGSEQIYVAPLSLNTVSDLVQSYFGLQVVRIEELNGYEDRNFYIKGLQLSNEMNADINENYKDTAPEEFVAKIVNPKDSQDTGFLQAQCLVMNLLNREGINCPRPVVSLQGNYHEMIKISTTSSQDKTHQKFALRLFHFVQGDIFANAPCTVDLIFSAGTLTARLDKTLQKFYSHSLERKNYIWDLRNLNQVILRSYVIKNHHRNKLVHDVINKFCNNVLPQLNELQQAVIHGDINEQNLLVTKQDGYQTTGIIDFGHLIHSYSVFEVSIAAAYMMIEYYPKDPFEASGHFIAAYHSEHPLTRQELELVTMVSAARLAQSLIMGAYAHSLDPKNTYVLTTQKHGWPVLELLTQTPQWEIHATWMKVFAERKVKWPEN